jgi:hypothetical protein
LEEQVQGLVSAVSLAAVEVAAVSHIMALALRGEDQEAMV